MEPLCEGCGGAEFVTDFGCGDTICRRCGLVTSDKLYDEQPKFVAPTTGSSKTLPRHLARLYDRDRNYDALKQFRSVGVLFSFSELGVDVAHKMFSDISSQIGKKLKGTTKNAMMAICVYYSMKSVGVNGGRRSQKEIAAAFDTDIKSLTAARHLLRKCNLNLDVDQGITPSDVAIRHLSTLVEDPKERWEASLRIKEYEAFVADDVRFQTRKAKVLGAALLFKAVSKLGCCSEEQVSELCHVSKSTMDVVLSQLAELD